MALRDTLRIMVVDDMSTSRGLILQALDALQIKHVDFAADGVAALQKLAGNPAHLVISDYNMPNMDGLHLLKALRENKMTARMGFILITGRADRPLIEAGQKLGMNNFLRKPFSTEQMRACIQAVTGPL